MLKTRQQVREDFARKGLSYTGWALKYGYDPNLVRHIVNDDQTRPKRKCIRGESHNIAVALGLKDGEVCRPQQLAAA